MRISEGQFASALAAAYAMSDQQLLDAAGGTGARSYFVVVKGRALSLKSVIRLGYKREGFKWDGPHSNVASRQLRTNFVILHITGREEKKRLERQRKTAERWARDPRFRADVLELYSTTCVISGCTSPDAIDAAHLLGVGAQGDDKPENGIVLRADLHRLFDADPIKMAINPRTLTAHFVPECRDYYSGYEGKAVVLPAGGPKAAAFMDHWKRFKKSERKRHAK